MAKKKAVKKATKNIPKTKVKPKEKKLSKPNSPLKKNAKGNTAEKKKVEVKSKSSVVSSKGSKTKTVAKPKNSAVKLKAKPAEKAKVIAKTTKAVPEKVMKAGVPSKKTKEVLSTTTGKGKSNKVPSNDKSSLIATKKTGKEQALEAKKAKGENKNRSLEDFKEEEFVRDVPKRDSTLIALEEKIQDQISSLAETFTWDDIQEALASLEFFIDHKTDECREANCDNLATTLGYCRIHYISNWKSLQRKKEILTEGNLQKLVSDLIAKYPVQYIETLISDLAEEKDFFKVLSDLNLISDVEFDEVGEYAYDEDDEDDDIEIEARSLAMGRAKFDEDIDP